MNPTFKRSIPFIIMVLITMIWTVATQAQAQSKAPGEQVVSPSSATEVEKQFHKARENFLKKDYQNAAAEIRQGAAFLKKEAERATDEGKQALMASTQELGKLTDQVQKGTVSSARELDEAFARAHYALARYYQAKASESWARKAVSEAGQDLKAAAVHLENALNWAGQHLEAGRVQAIREGKQIGEKMEKGGGWVDSEVRKAIEGVGKEIDETGHKIGFFK